jgi:hypothetical protein
MAMRFYEGMFLLDTGKMAGDLNKAAETLVQIVTEPPDEDLFDPAPDRNRRRRPADVREG